MTMPAVNPAPTKADPQVKTALDHVRAAAQELHGAISDAVAKRGGATKADLEAFGHKVTAITESAKSAVSSRNAAVKKQVDDAVAKLESTQKHVDEGLKASGDKVQTAVRQALADAHASVQKFSEAVAAHRSANKSGK